MSQETELLPLAGSLTLAAAPRVAAIIPNWNGAARLERCLASLAAQHGEAPAVIVVDNASTDGSAELAERMGAQVIRLPANVGFAGAVNGGIAACSSELLAVINNDVELDPGWLVALVQALDAFPECGMVTGRTMMRDRQEVLDGAGDALSLGLAAVRLGYGRPVSEAGCEPREVLAVSGAASLFRRAVFETAGPFEEMFFAYLEDVELCLRAQLAGFHARYVPEAIAWHEGSASTGGAAALDPRVVTWITAHQLLLAARYCRGAAARTMMPRVLLTQALWAGRMVLAARTAAWLRGVAAAARRWRAMREGGGFEPRLPPSSLPGSNHVVELLRASEAQILLDRVPTDRFWRVYFRCFPLQRPAGDFIFPGIGFGSRPRGKK